MNKLLGQLTAQYSQDSLYSQQKAKALVIASLLVVPSMSISIIMHWLDHKPAIVLLGDVLFLAASLAGLYLVYHKRPVPASNIFIFSLILLIFLHNILSDYLFGTDLTYYRILETCLLFVIIVFSVALFMQRYYQMYVIVTLGILAIVTHYFIIAFRTGMDPMQTTPFSFLISYLIVFVILSIISIRILTTSTNHIRRAEGESERIKQINLELESKVKERTLALETQNEELKRVNSELDRFVYSASHDLRAPLLSILGLINLAKEEEDVEKVREYLHLKEKSVVKLDSFIKNIVNLSKNSRTEIRQDLIDFQEMISGIFVQLDYMEKASRVEKIVDIQQPYSFYSDTSRISVILNNLIANAIRYSFPQQVNSYVKVSVQVSQHDVELKVEDNGCGIAEDYLEKIFLMFFRATSDSTGSGLGLYIVKETLEKLSGTIHVSSTLGKGTIFTVKIPSKVPCHSLSIA